MAERESPPRAGRLGVLNTTKEGRLLYMEGQGESLRGRLLAVKKKMQVRQGSGASRLYD
jgi:hypothetical protein